MSCNYCGLAIDSLIDEPFCNCADRKVNDWLDEGKAEEIVRAVNSHAKLVEALQTIESRLSKGATYSDAMHTSMRVCVADAISLAKIALSSMERESQ